jgi:hypothetical protein
MVLGGGLEPPRLTAYAPQTYVSAISPPELVQGREMFNTTYRSRKADYLAVWQGRAPLVPSATRVGLLSGDTRTSRARPYRSTTYGTKAVLIP